MWKALQHKNFARLFYAALISEIGTRIHRIALLVLVYTTTGDVLWVSLALGVQLVTTVAVAPVLSAWADGQERRRLMVLSDLGRVLLVPLIPALGMQSPVILLTLIFAIEVLRNIHEPVITAVIPELIPESDLDAANALMLFTQRFAEVAFVGLAGVLVGLVGAAPAFWIDALSYLLSALILMRLPLLAGAVARPGGYWLRVREGIGFLVRQPAIRRTVGILFAAAMFGSVESVLGVALAVSVLNVGSTGFGVLEAAMALGAVVGTVLVPKLTQRLPRERLFLLGLLAFGLFEASIGALPIFGWTLIAYLFAGQLNMTFIIPARSILQLNTPSELRTRVFAAFGAVMNGAVLIGTLLGGALERPLGVPLVFVLAGLMVAAVAALMLARSGLSSLKTFARVLNTQVSIWHKHSFE